MSHNNFPDGWNEDKVRKVLAHYEEQPQDEALAEDESGVSGIFRDSHECSSHDLVAQVSILAN